MGCRAGAAQGLQSVQIQKGEVPLTGAPAAGVDEEHVAQRLHGRHGHVPVDDGPDVAHRGGVAALVALA